MASLGPNMCQVRHTIDVDRGWCSKVDVVVWENLSEGERSPKRKKVAYLPWDVDGLTPKRRCAKASCCRGKDGGSDSFLDACSRRMMELIDRDDEVGTQVEARKKRKAVG